MSVYTDSMVAELHGLGVPVTRPQVDAFAEQYSLSVKSVVAKLRHLDIEYQPPVAEAKPKARRKIEIVRNIERMFGYDGDTYIGLDNATVSTLETLERDVQRIFGVDSESID